jgi:hypothetical protein
MLPLVTPANADQRCIGMHPISSEPRLLPFLVAAIRSLNHNETFFFRPGDRTAMGTP